MIAHWLFKPAKWYQFWLPQSGFFGGILVLVVLLPLLFVLNSCGVLWTFFNF